MTFWQRRLWSIQGRETDRETEIDTQASRQTDTSTETDTQTEIDTQAGRQTDNQTDRGSEMVRTSSFFSS